MTRDMTTGSPWKLILQFSIPTALGLIFQQLYSMADTVIVGRTLGVDALAAVGSTGSLSFLIIGFMSGVCSGFSIPVSQYFGAKNKQELQRAVATGAWVALILGAIITVVTVAGTEWIMRLMQTPQNIFVDACDYIRVIFLGTLATVLYNLLSSYLRALGDSKTPLVFLVISSVLNIVFDLVFIMMFHMGVSGAAWATVLSQLISGLLCLLFIAKKFPALHVAKENISPRMEHVSNHLSIGVPMGLQFSITAVGCAILQGATNTLGSAAVAAITAADRSKGIFQCLLDAPAITMATYCGQNLGAGRMDRIRIGVKQGTILAIILSILCAIMVYFTGSTVGLLFLDSAETEIFALMDEYFLWNLLFFPCLVYLLVLRNAIQGMGYTVPAMAAGVFELVARAAVAIFFVKTYGFTAVCIASPAAWIAADVLLWYVYRQLINRLDPQ